MKTKTYNLSSIFIIVLVSLMMSSSVYAQALEKFSYQAVIRDADDNLVANQTIGMQINILHSSPSGASVFTETHTPTTNANGLISIEIGSGTPVHNTISNISWYVKNYYLKTEVDPTGGTNYTITAITQILSVPYAIYAETAEKADSAEVAEVALIAENVVEYTAGTGIDITNYEVSNTAISTTYEVGDYAQGGVVFWVDETGEHGLVCSKSELDQVYWSPDVLGRTCSYGDGPYAGEMNTTLIIAKYTHNLGFLYSAMQCSKYGSAYEDWYLPSSKELYEMYVNKDVINATLAANNNNPLESADYWSSTEVGSDIAHTRNLGTGSEGNTYKKTHCNTRAVRAF